MVFVVWAMILVSFIFVVPSVVDAQSGHSEHQNVSHTPSGHVSYYPSTVR